MHASAFRISDGEGSRRNNISVNRDSIIQIFHYRISIMTLAILQPFRMKRARCKISRVFKPDRKHIAFRLSLFARISFPLLIDDGGQIIAQPSLFGMIYITSGSLSID